MTDEPATGTGGGLVRLRVDVAYDGTGFAGWARQPDQPTVQEVLEDALAVALRLPRPVVAVTCAGRTDAGVHARGQVAHLDVPDAVLARLGAGSSSPWTEVLVRRLNGILGDDVRVRGCALAPAGFDARFSALWRRYAYRVCDGADRADPLRRGHVLAWARPLDLEAMNVAGSSLVGEHDFLAYCRSRTGASTVRELQQVWWERVADLAVLTVRADAFCHHMVRALTGALLSVGEGRRAPSWPAAVLAAARRDPAVRVVPAHGLTLEEVGYPVDAELGARALRTRRRRG